MMTDRVWIEMPTVASEAEDGSVRPKYPVQGSAFLIHQDGKVYVAFKDDLTRKEAMKHVDCRQLTPSEARKFEENLIFPLPPHLFPDKHSNESRPTGLGDVVSWFTRRLGITECNACQQRKRRFNRIPVWGWWNR